MLELLLILGRQQARYDHCPTCRKSWIARPFSEKDPEVGRETFQCKCGVFHRTQFREWAHFRIDERRRYFLWNAETLLVLIFGAVIVLGAYFVVDSHGFEVTAEWVLIAGASFVLIGWLFRGLTVKRSLARQPHEDPMFQPGSMPWEW